MTLNRFTCEQVFARLDDFVDRELSSDDMRLVHEHLETCEVCAGEYSFEATVLADVRRKVRRIGVPTALVVRIAERLRQAQEEEQRSTPVAGDDRPPLPEA